ncbi:MAG: 50S ribosomal protein L10 [Candidatus Margulisbacteria bacterium]|nr:50S ribosomal protein L10 [Candidatus Margulisiibacteriota bacterium]
MSERAIAEKSKVVESIKEKLGRSKVVLLSNYQGMTVKDVTDLRKKLRVEDAELRVVKNTLLLRAFEQAGIAGLKEHFAGSTAVILGYKDAVTPLKIFVKLMKDSEKGALRAGLVEKDVYGEKELREIAKLPSKEVLLGKVVGGLNAPIYGLVNVLQGPIRKLVYALDAVKAKKS